MRSTKLIGLLFFTSITLFSCKKDDGDGVNTSTEIENYEGDFNGEMDADGIYNSLEGIFRTSTDGTFSLNLISGSLEGNLESIDGTLRLSVNYTYGLFSDTSDLIGTLSKTSEGYDFSVTGTYIDGNPITISGTSMTIPESNQAYHDSKSKSSVYFTHNESCNATITINNTVLSGLNAHYESNGGLCASVYEGFLSTPRDVENEESHINCHTVRLLGQDGNYITFEDCNTATFILAKNTQYSYFVEWENGETESGEFISPDGGSRMAICLENAGPECNGNGGGNQDPILITTDTVEVDFANSQLPAGDNGILPFIDPTVFKMYDTTIQGDNFTGIVIGDRYSSNTPPSGYSDTRIRLYVRYGIANGDYEVKWWSSSQELAPIGIEVDYGVNGVPYSNNDFPQSGNINISNYDAVNKTCTITFEDVVIAINGSAGTSYNMKFSGVIAGTFTTD